MIRMYQFVFLFNLLMFVLFSVLSGFTQNLLLKFVSKTLCIYVFIYFVKYLEIESVAI